MVEINEYIRDRIQPRIDWYDKRAVSCKMLHRGLDYAATAGGIALPLLIHVESIPRIALSVLASVVVLVMSIDRIGRFGELWVKYRLAYECLNRELNLFKHNAGPYVGLSPDSTLLVERIENILGSEAEAWQELAMPSKQDVPRERSILDA